MKFLLILCALLLPGLAMAQGSLGTMALQNKGAVDIEGGTIVSTTIDATNTVALGAIDGFGANVEAALGIAIGSAGAPVLFNGALGTPSSGIATNLTGTAAGLTAGTVTTNANLTGHVTSVGNAAVLGSFTVAELNTAISDANVATGGGTATGTNTGDQTSIVGITGSLAEFNAALTGADFATGGGTVTGASSGTNTGDQTSVTGNAGTATALQTGRTISVSTDATGTSAAFDGTGNATIPVTITNDAVTNAKAANMAQSTIKGRASAAGAGDPTDLTANEVSTILDSATDPFLRTSAAAAGSVMAYILVRDEKAQNTAGGTFTSGAWRTRTLNTEVSDTGGDCTLAANQITLAAGTYRCRIICPAFNVGRHQARLYNTTDAAVVLPGSSSNSNSTSPSVTYSEIVGRFTVAAGKALEVQHQCDITFATSGLGLADNFAAEIYTIAVFEKE